MPNLAPIESVAPELSETFGEIFEVPFSWQRVFYTVLLLVACIVVMRVIMALLNRTIQRFGVEKSLHTFLKSIVHILLWFITFVIVMGYLGVELSHLVAVLGIIGLAVTLAIQGILGNLAGGIMVLLSKPFKVGDYVEASGVGGEVLDVGLVYTKVKTFDNKLIFVPNGEVCKEKIVNYTYQKERRVDLTFSVSYDTAPQLVKDILHAAIGRNNKTLFSPEPFVGMTKINDSSVDYTMRVWCATDDYWDVYYELLEELWDDLNAAGVDLTYNHLNVHIKEEKRDG